MTFTIEVFKLGKQTTETVLEFSSVEAAAAALAALRNASNAGEYDLHPGAMDEGLRHWQSAAETHYLTPEAVFSRLKVFMETVDRSELGMPQSEFEAAQQKRMDILRERFPEADDEEIESYLWGPDDPKDYFSKVADDDELAADFRTFMDQYEG